MSSRVARGIAASGTIPVLELTYHCAEGVSCFLDVAIIFVSVRSIRSWRRERSYLLFQLTDAAYRIIFCRLQCVFSRNWVNLEIGVLLKIQMKGEITF